MGTPRRPARGSWSLVAETRVRGFAPEAPRQRGQAAAPTPQSYLSVQGPFQPRPCLCICAPRRSSESRRLCGAALLARQPSASLPPRPCAVPPAPTPKVLILFSVWQMPPQPPPPRPHYPLAPLEPVLWMLPHPTSLNFPCPKFPSVPGAPAWQYPGGGRPHLSGGLGPTGPAPGPSVHRHSSP